VTEILRLHHLFDLNPLLLTYLLKARAALSIELSEIRNMAPLL